MSDIGEAKARIRGLKETLEEQIGLLASQKSAVESLKSSIEGVFAQSSKEVDSTVDAQLRATTQGLDDASSRVSDACDELDNAASML